jgi:hypothetical protein
MAIRVKVRLRTRQEPVSELSTVALVNSGFEADSPQILVPIRLAKELGLYGRLIEARVESYGTVAGPVRMYVLPSSVEVWIEEPDAESPRVVCDALISDTEVEALISDYLAGELGIIAEDFRRGFWRLNNDPGSRRRTSYPPQRWI